MEATLTTGRIEWPTRLRQGAVVACTAFQIIVLAPSLGWVGAVAFTIIVLSSAMVGLKWRFFWAALRGAGMAPREFSCAGAVLAGCLGACIALAAFRSLALWQLAALPFVVTSLTYYLVGKAGCIVFRCCESSRSLVLRLPYIEVVACAAIIVATLIMWQLHLIAMVIDLSFAAFAFGVLRLSSRILRQHSLRRQFLAPDTAGLFLLGAIWLSIGLSH